MVDKRHKKMELITGEIVPPELVGPEDYKNLVLCWGSTYNIVAEALEKLARDDTAMLHYKQLHPLPTATIDYLSKARKTIIIESNSTGQFAKQIKLNTGVDIDEKILKYSGLSFSVEEVVERLETLLD